MKYSKKWFSIFIWIGLVALLILVALVILSFIIPFSRNIKWIENTTIAYYNWYSWIEHWLYYINKIRTNLTTESWSTNISNGSWYKFNTFSSGTIIPQPWYWNSEFDKDYNIISISEPIQLEIGRNIIPDWSKVEFIFKVPNFDNDIATSEILSWNTTPIINWILSAQNDTLIASWSYINASDVKSSNCSTNCSIKLTENNFKNWFTIDWIWQTFSEFYWNNCRSSWSWCTLKMSVINDLVLTTWNQIPYLEYKINFGWYNVPDRYFRITSFWLSKWFQKKLDVRVSQQTVNTAFDFTVFQ